MHIYWVRISGNEARNLALDKPIGDFLKCPLGFKTIDLVPLIFNFLLFLGGIELTFLSWLSWSVGNDLVQAGPGHPPFVHHFHGQSSGPHPYLHYAGESGLIDRSQIF